MSAQGRIGFRDSMTVTRIVGLHEILKELAFSLSLIFLFYMENVCGHFSVLAGA